MDPTLDRIGIELEGGWNSLPSEWKEEKVDIIADLSIDGRTLPTDRPLTSAHVGEIVSPPLPPEEWEEWLSTFYPDDTNITCGLHVHISLPTKRQYALLMSTKFERRVLATASDLATSLGLHKRNSLSRGEKRHYIWDRLEGKNPFCLFGVLPADQTPIREKRIGMRARYASLNFCWSMHGTLEYRLLPMFPEGSGMAASFIKAFLGDVEEELKARGEKRFFLSTALREKNGVIEELEERNP